MNTRVLALATACCVVWASKAASQDDMSAHHAHGDSMHADSAFSALQRRGRTAMGVDQYTSAHHFVVLENGGRIELQRDVDDSAGIQQIRHHLRSVARSFAAGDFTTPGFVHDRVVPGTAVMAARRALIRYDVLDLPRGGAIRITTSDDQALRAVHEFLRFQASDHRTGDSSRVSSPEHAHHPVP